MFLKLIICVEESPMHLFLRYIGERDDDLYSVEYGIHEVNGVVKEAKCKE